MWKTALTTSKCSGHRDRKPQLWRGVVIAGFENQTAALRNAGSGFGADCPRIDAKLGMNLVLAIRLDVFRAYELEPMD